jgi:type IV pilus assembly protein PilB
MKKINDWIQPRKRLEIPSYIKEKKKISREGGFGQYLNSRGIINSIQLFQVLEEQEQTGKRLGEILVKQGFLAQNEMMDLLSEYLGVPKVDLAQVEIDQGIVSIISEEIAWRYLLIPVSLVEGILYVAMADPLNHRAVDDLRILTGYGVQPFLASEVEVEAAIRKYLTVEKSIAELALVQEELSEKSFGRPFNDNSMEEGNDAPTIRLVDSLLRDAVAQGASDIHWEPGEAALRVRYRMDGKLETKQSFPLHVAHNLIARIKIISRLDVSERRLPQDGRTKLYVNGKNIDLRVSCLPTVYGEKVVVRILNPDTAQRSLEALGMRQDVETGIRQLISQPYGIILVVGPTGSGKTTTLYALLQELASDSLNIVSIEDPVEYQLPGVVSVQVHAKIGLTFAQGLRSILRQDPDVIMIGEIRDEETARIAIAAALTGHLVLSTLHTNTAAEAITRLLDMGIEPYLLAAVIRGVLSQRLVRRLCEHCKKSYTINRKEQRVMDLPNDFEQAFQAVGCSHCRHTGYSGRIGLHELLVYNQDIKNLVLENKSSQLIEKAALNAGMLPLRLDGYLKVKNGLTSLEEVWYSTTGMTNL